MEQDNGSFWKIWGAQRCDVDVTLGEDGVGTTPQGYPQTYPLVIVKATQVILSGEIIHCLS